MYIVAQHEISDPRTFFETARATPLPEGLTLHQILPSENGSRCVCLWEAGSLDEVSRFVEEYVGHVSRNAFFPVAADNAIGLQRLNQT